MVAQDIAAEHEESGRHRIALTVLALALLLGMTTWFSATAVVPQLQELWDLSEGQAAGMTIAVQLGFVVGAFGSALANLADRLAPRRFMLYGSIGASLANLLLLVVEGPATGMLLRGLTGLFLAGVYPPAMKAMATWFRRRRGTALGVMVGALTLGSATPHLVNGLGGLDWRVVIVTTSVLTLIGGVVAAKLGADGPYPFPTSDFDPRKTWAAISDRSVVLANLGYFGHMWELYAMWAWFGVFFAHNLSVRGVAEPLRFGALGTFAVIGVGAIGCWVGGLLGDAWGRWRTTALAMTISGASALLIGFLERAPWPLVLGLGLIWGFWVVADSAQFSTLVTEVSDQAFVGTAVTLQLAVGFLLTVATIWIVPFLVVRAGWGVSFAVLGLGPAVGIVAMLNLGRLERGRIS